MVKFQGRGHTPSRVKIIDFSIFTVPYNIIYIKNIFLEFLDKIS